MTENCDDRSYIGINLPLMDGDFILAKVDIPGFTESDLITDLPDHLLKSARKMGKKEGVNRIISFFKPEAGGEFPNNSTLRLKYSPQAWQDGSDNSLGRPIVFYLILIDGAWVNDWMEFTSVSATEPTASDPFGYICIDISGLPDPLIGGC